MATRRARRRSSASRTIPFTRRVKREKIPGRSEGGPTKSATSFARLLGRLRRLEFAVIYLGGNRRDFQFDKFTEDVLSLEADAQIESRGGNLRRGEVQVPHEGGTAGKTPRAAENLRRSESGDEDGELSPFPPGEPDEPPQESN